MGKKGNLGKMKGMLLMALSERTAGKVGQNRAKKESGAEKSGGDTGFFQDPAGKG